jgi:geranylgeranyl diphosphate synthase, type I
VKVHVLSTLGGKREAERSCAQAFGKHDRSEDRHSSAYRGRSPLVTTPSLPELPASDSWQALCLAAKTVPQAGFATFAGHAKMLVEADLATFFAERPLGDGATEAERVLVETVRDLTMRPAKRARAAMVAMACALFSLEPTRVSEHHARAAMVAMEVLQTYLLIHDDWMDGDEVRRGGPSAHVALEARYSGQGATAAVLSGDYACALAQTALVEGVSPHQEEGTQSGARVVLRMMQIFARLQRDVVLGQTIDTLEAFPAEESRLLGHVDRLHARKTASYTIEGPVLLGLAAAGWDAQAAAALREWAVATGIAFQMRDDLLGTFGSGQDKPITADLRNGKRTILLARALADARTAKRAREVLQQQLSAEELGAFAEDLRLLGVVARVEDDIRATQARADQAAKNLPHAAIWQAATLELSHRSA